MTDLEDDLLHQRSKIKNECRAILKANGKVMEEPSLENPDSSLSLENCFGAKTVEEESNVPYMNGSVNTVESSVSSEKVIREEVFIQQQEEINVSCRSSSSMVECVDSMLDNVNKIIYKISDPGKNVSGDLVNMNGEVKKLYDSLGEEEEEEEEEEEYVQDYIVFDQATGKETSILDAGQKKIEANTVIDVEKLERESLENPLSLDTDIHTQVVGWDKYLGISGKISPVKETTGTGNVFDSLFTNSFLSAANHQQQDEKVSTKPKRNILKRKSTGSNTPLQDKKVTFDTKHTKHPTGKCEEALQEVADFKKEIQNDILNGKPRRLSRELQFVDDGKSTTKASGSSQAALSCLACMQSEYAETPLKHDEVLCEKLNVTRKPTVCSAGVSTDDLLNESTSITNAQTSQDTTAVQQQAPSKSSKKKKKKKKSASAAAAAKESVEKQEQAEDEKPTAATATVTLTGSHTVVNSSQTSTVKEEKELEKEFAKIIKELEAITKQKVLLHKDVSLTAAYSSIPPGITKELLLLKISLESPGVLKNATNETRNSCFDETACSNYVGLITLFIFLLHSNALKYQYASPEVPFDVVTMFQCHIDDELFLVVGVCENEKSHKQKSKRTKLGSYFFHTVSQFLNNNTLEQLLVRIAPSSNHLGELSKPGRGKLSSFINIMPDGGALTRLLSTRQSLTVHNDSKSLKNLAELNLASISTLTPPTKTNGQEMTCITLENVNTMSPRSIAAALKNIYTQSLEVVGLRLGYVPQVNNPNIVRSVLAICIQDHKVASSEQGHLLFGKNSELKKDLNITFQSLEDQRQSFATPTATLRYTLNTNRAFKQVVQWFGPHFQDIDDLKEYTTTLKSTSKNASVNLNAKKKKWAVDNPSKVAYLSNAPSHAVVLVSSAVPSWFIPHIVTGANKKGIHLESISKNMLTTELLNSLGIPEASSRYFGHSPPVWKKTSRGAKDIGSFIFLVFRGNSVVVRLNNLMDNFAAYFIKGESTATIHQTFDNSQTLRTFLKKQRNTNGFFNYQRMDCFSVLHLNEHSAQLGTPYCLAPRLQLHDLRARVAETCCIPNTSLAALVIYGDSLLSQMSNLLRLMFVGQSDMLSESLIGVKVIRDLSVLDAHELVTDEPNTISWKNTVQTLTGSDVLLVILKTVDFLRTSQLRTAISLFLFSSKVDCEKNGIIVHSDAVYIFDLMFMYFHPNELYSDLRVDSKLVSPAFLEETHPFLSSLDKMYRLRLSDNALVEKVVVPDSVKTDESFLLDDFKRVVYQIHPQTMNYPCEMLLRQQVSFAGVSVQFNGENFLAIVKAISRIIRMGFRIVVWKFPVYQLDSYWLNIIFSRADALYFMYQIMNEIETSFQSLKFGGNLKFEVYASQDTLVMFAKENGGGIFHTNYMSLIKQMNFTKDPLIDSRDKRSLEWHPLNSTIGRHFHRHRMSTTIGDSTREVSVLILTAPLINGHFAGKSFPRSCIFPEFLQTFESLDYQCLASRLTCVDETNAEKMLSVYGVTDPKKRHLMKTYMTSRNEPFMIVLLLGVCIQSNFWLEIERIHSEEEDVAILRKFMLTTSSKRQVDYLVPAFFDTVLPNSKIEVHTLMSDVKFEEKESQLLL